MKQTIKYLAMLMVMLSFGLTSTSCSDDDNENLEDGNEETSLLVGSWEWYNDYYDSLETWTFNANGTYEWELGDYMILTGKYIYDSSTGILLVLYYGEDDESWTEKWRVLSLSSSELSLEPIDAPSYNSYNTVTLTRKI